MMSQALDQPLYRRVQDEIVGEFPRGRAPAGTRLPSLRRLARAGISFAPGEAFFVAPADQPYMRLNFAALDETQIARGIETLGALARAATGREVES
jgi:DNA-binding transcriptional MocR family regulator